jgi:hypothetical protein
MRNGKTIYGGNTQSPCRDIFAGGKKDFLLELAVLNRNETEG